jgi:hypothetical protein
MSPLKMLENLMLIIEKKRQAQATRLIASLFSFCARCYWDPSHPKKGRSRRIETITWATAISKLRFLDSRQGDNTL